MTSNDRHASHDSPYRTGQHVPLAQSRHAPLTSVATNADESRMDLTTPDPSDPLATNKSPMVASSPYTPGMRSAMHRTQSGDQSQATTARSDSTEIQMQAFSDGLPPPPPVSHSWKRIDGWLEDKYQELWDNLGDGCTQNDINELEHELDCTLPLEVRESLMAHDGQERGGRPTGVIFSSMLLDCEEIVQEWKNWRTVNEEYFSRPNSVQQQSVQPSPKALDGAMSSKALDGLPSSSANPNGVNDAKAANSHWKEDLLNRQDSQPSGAIQKAYSHPSWIPLARDWGGNNLAVDLAPGPAGKWGQVILCGRDYDCKYVVARSWAALLATFADDLLSGKVEINEDSGEMKLRAFKNAEPPYLEILRWRADQKYGRKARKKSGPPGAPLDTRIGNAAGIGRGSPYGSPTTSVDGERGRSPQRFSRMTNGTVSPREAGRMGSPLARVNEELPLASNLQSNSPRKESFPRTEKLVSTESTPRASIDIKSEVNTGTPLRESMSVADGKENVPNGEPRGLGVQNLEAFQHNRNPSGEMKTVEI
ncbi:MAG: hypothetical protein Q9162_005046 [Coniocarpon cinnabarinum]